MMSTRLAPSLWRRFSDGPLWRRGYVVEVETKQIVPFTKLCVVGAALALVACHSSSQQENITISKVVEDVGNTYTFEFSNRFWAGGSGDPAWVLSAHSLMEYHSGPPLIRVSILNAGSHIDQLKVPGKRHGNCKFILSFGCVIFFAQRAMEPPALVDTRPRESSIIPIGYGLSSDGAHWLVCAVKRDDKLKNDLRNYAEDCIVYFAQVLETSGE